MSDDIRINNDGTMSDEEKKNLEMDAASGTAITEEDEALDLDMIDEGMQVDDPEEEGDEIA
ncbi:MAG: hypothetical protein RL641_562 [Candidatus Parcubacteria bacterium]|jgi:hypothetical protein